MRTYALAIGNRLRRVVRRARETVPVRTRLACARAGRKKIIVFESDWLGIYPFLRPLVRRCAASGKVFPVLATNRTEMPAFREECDRDPSLRKSGYLLIPFECVPRAGLRPDMVISCQPWSQVADKFDGIPKIQTLHGCADKRGELFGPRDLADFTHLFSPGPLVTELAQSRFGPQWPVQILPIGYPKVDDLFDGTYSRNCILREMGLDPALPTILYAPTWEKEASWEQYGFRVLDTLRQVEANVILKLHHLTLAPPDNEFCVRFGHGGRNWREALRNRLPEYPRVRPAQLALANPYMAAADLLITDTSGIAVEFCLLNRPVLFLDTPLVTQQYGDRPLHQRFQSFGDTVQLEDLPDSVCLHLRRPQAKEAQRRAMIERLVYNLGHATEVAMRAISELLYRSPIRSKAASR